MSDKSIKDKTKESLIKDLEWQLSELRRDIDKRRLELVRITEQQQIAKRRRQLLVETIRFIKEG